MSKFRRQKQNNYPDAIFCADWHLRESSPLCRTDDYWIAQERKIDFILNLAKKYKIPILVSGDLGDKPRWSCRLLEWAINKFKDTKIFVVAGQHDLPNHNLDLWETSGMGVLHAAEAIKFIQVPTIINNKFKIFPFSYGENISSLQKDDCKLPKIAMIHQMVVEKKDLFPDQNATKSHQLLFKQFYFDIILSGDNHNSFVAKYENKLLVNPGSMMRMTAAQIDHKPRVYKWYANTNEVEAVYLPIEKGVVDRIHIEAKQERDERMNTFVNRISDNIEIGLSFEQNLEKYFNKNRTKKSIQDKVWEAVGGI